MEQLHNAQREAEEKVEQDSTAGGWSDGSRKGPTDLAMPESMQCPCRAGGKEKSAKANRGTVAHTQDSSVVPWWYRPGLMVLVPFYASTTLHRVTSSLSAVACVRRQLIPISINL
jgi:hypothetical protein